MARSLGFGVLCVSLFTVTAPEMSAGQTAYVEGIDASHHNGSPDWSAAKADGIKFAFVKATEGQSFVDPQYATNRSQADALAIRFGSYHFARPDTTANDAAHEADHFVDTATLGGRHLLPVLDLEMHSGLGPRALRRWTKAWLGRVRERLGVKAMIYTTPAFWRDRMGDSRWFADNGYRLWIAHWYVDEPRVPAANWGGRGWTFWQYDDCGTVDGFDGCVDLDRYAAGGLGAVTIRNNR